MMHEALIASIPGAIALVELFGQWPFFHDAEVIRLDLDRAGQSRMLIHTFRMTSHLDARGRYVCDRHVIVNFHLGEILEMNMNGFNHQNVIAGLDIAKVESGLRLTLYSCYGLAGSITVNEVSISLESIISPGSVYVS